MIDDWSTPTAEHDRLGVTPRNDERAPTPPPDDALPVIGTSEEDLRVLDAYYHHLALDASEDPSPPTAAEQAQLDTIRAHNDRLLAMTPEDMLAERARRRRWRVPR